MIYKGFSREFGTGANIEEPQHVVSPVPLMLTISSQLSNILDMQGKRMTKGNFSELNRHAGGKYTYTASVVARNPDVLSFSSADLGVSRDITPRAGSGAGSTNLGTGGSLNFQADAQ